MQCGPVDQEKKTVERHQGKHGREPGTHTARKARRSATNLPTFFLKHARHRGQFLARVHQIEARLILLVEVPVNITCAVRLLVSPLPDTVGRTWQFAQGRRAKTLTLFTPPCHAPRTTTAALLLHTLSSSLPLGTYVPVMSAGRPSRSVFANG